MLYFQRDHRGLNHRRSPQQRIFKLKMAARAVYQIELANQLREKLNLKVIRKQPWLYIEGVPRNYAGSSRSADSRSSRPCNGEATSRRKGELARLKITRPGRNGEPLASKLFAQWQESDGLMAEGRSRRANCCNAAQEQRQQTPKAQDEAAQGQIHHRHRG